MLDSLRPQGLKPTRLLCPWDFPGKDTEVGCHFLFQGIFPTQGSNPSLLHCRQILYRLSYKGGIFSINSVPSKISLDSRLFQLVKHVISLLPSSLPPPCLLSPPLALSSFLFFPFAFWSDPLFLYTRLVCFILLITAPAPYVVQFTSYELWG